MGAGTVFGHRMPEKLQAALGQATELLKNGQLAAADALAQSMIDSYPDSADVCLLRSHIAQRSGRFDDMLVHAEAAKALAPSNVAVELRYLECLLYCGHPDKVLEALQPLEKGAHSDHRLLCRIAEFYTHCVDHESALRCYQRAVQLQPANPDYLFSLSATQLALGQLNAAERTLDFVIRVNPKDYDAYRNRATLRKQTAESNHVEEILAVLEAGVDRPAGEVQLCYALAKEYEDLGDYVKAFGFLRRGADKRRSLLSYKVDKDESVIRQIMRTFGRELFASASGGLEQAGPVFVMGLPRSGTTLVDRILSSHSEVASLGELNDFAFSLMHVAGNADDKLDFVQKTAAIDFHQLGRRYLDGLRRYGRRELFLIDKTPSNYLYLGLIRLALPQAKVIHIRRNPMDSCYGMYRTLFRAGYPFSYNLNDLARYYIAYHGLMKHWQSVCGDWFLDIEYENLIDDQEAVSRDIVGFCGLEWQEACLEFHKNSSPVATASSAQVRRPVYRDALQRWRRYEAELQPLAARLADAGIEL